MLRSAATALLSMVVLAGTPVELSATPTVFEPKFFASHGVVYTDKIWWWQQPVAMQYAVKGTATLTVNDNGDASLSIRDFTVKVQITTLEGRFAGWVFADRDLRNRVFTATYDATAGVYRVRTDSSFWFFTPFDAYWSAGWTGIILSVTPDGQVSVSVGTDAFEDWWFL